MSNFQLFFPLGIQHITDLNGLDHILFIAALCSRYIWQDWRKLLVLVTAFTIGHSITLTLSTLNIINIPTAYTEFLIAVTIVVTAISNCFIKDFSFKHKFPAIYFFALFFGLIHGLGFSTLLKSMLGKDENIVVQLLSFNLGLEIGQLIIVSVFLTITFIFTTILSINRKHYLFFVSGAIAALAIEMAINRIP